MDQQLNMSDIDFSDLEDLLDIPLNKTDVDEGQWNSDDSPMGSPLGSLPPSPGLAQEDPVLSSTGMWLPAINMINIKQEPNSPASITSNDYDNHEDMDITEWLMSVGKGESTLTQDQAVELLNINLGCQPVTVTDNEGHTENSLIGQESDLNNVPTFVLQSPSVTSNMLQRCDSGSIKSIRKDLHLGDEKLADVPVRDLNKILQGYPREVITKLKQKRRTLKNRGYAQNCRQKRLRQRGEIEIENETLHVEVSKLKEQVDNLQKENTKYKKICQQLVCNRKQDILPKNH